MSRLQHLKKMKIVNMSSRFGIAVEIVLFQAKFFHVIIFPLIELFSILPSNQLNCDSKTQIFKTPGNSRGPSKKKTSLFQDDIRLHAYMTFACAIVLKGIYMVAAAREVSPFPNFIKSQIFAFFPPGMSPSDRR